MAELLGTVAAAVQLAGVCSSLLDTLQTVRYASRNVRKYRSQLKSLESICLSIQGNTLLRTKEIGAEVQSILSSVTYYLDIKLGTSGSTRWMKYLVVHRELTELFKTLEEKKSSLVLRISSITASAIEEIRSHVRLIAGKKLSESSTVSDRWITTSPEDSTDEEESSMVSKLQKNYQCHSRHSSATLADMEENNGKALYSGQEHRGHGEMLNGPEINEELTEPLPKNWKWEENIKKACQEEKCSEGLPDDVQINGPDFLEAKFAKSYDGIWKDNIMEANGKQINGPRIGRKK